MKGQNYIDTLAMREKQQEFLEQCEHDTWLMYLRHITFIVANEMRTIAMYTRYAQSQQQMFIYI